MKRKLGWVAALASIALAAACGGGSSGTPSSGGVTPGSDALSVAEKVSVVDAQANAEASIVRALKVDFSKAATDLLSTSAYATDKTNTYVQERSTEAFSQINEILCMIAQTKYDEMINLGDYRVLNDMTLCNQSSDSAAAAGAGSQDQSTGSNASQYEEWTVNSSRETDQPHIVKAWIHQAASAYEPAMTIFAKLAITEATSDSNPLGIFTIDFKACADGDTACAVPFMQGFMKAERDSNNDVNVKFYATGGEGDFSMDQRVILYKGLGTGSVSLSEFDPYEGQMSKAFNIAYNDNYFYRGNAAGEAEAVCLDRVNFNTNIWRYGLYFDENHATPGARVARASPGFPIKFGDYYGFAGYYGVWLPSEANLATGDTVYKQEFSSSGPPTETPYTVFTAGGRLKRHVQQTVTLGEVKDVPLSWNKCEDQGGGQWECVDNRVKWTGTQLVKDATRSQSTGWMWQDLGAEEVVTFGDTDYSFNFYSESLGGDGRIDLMNSEGQQLLASQLTNDTVVIFNKVSTVYPGDTVPATLACFENCMDPSTIDTESPYFANSTYMGGEDGFNMVDMNVAPGALVAGTHYIAYTFDSDSMLLKQAGNSVVSTATGNGVWGGSLVDLSNPASLAELECDWNPNGTCTWKVWNLSVFYTWETGGNEWNKLTALQAADGSFISFDPPLMLKYTRASTGAKYYLEYNGFGDLFGIPGKCVDANTGLDTACYTEGQDKRNIRWVPEFSISAGSKVTDVSNNLEYYVKPLDQEQQMVSVDAASCTGAGLALTSYTLPDESLVTDPGIGAEPTVTNAPAVIGGVLQ